MIVTIFRISLGKLTLPWNARGLFNHQNQRKNDGFYQKIATAVQCLRNSKETCQLEASWQHFLNIFQNCWILSNAKCAKLEDLVRSWKTNTSMQKSASIQPGTSRSMYAGTYGLPNTPRPPRVISDALVAKAASARRTAPSAPLEDATSVRSSYARR